MARRRVLKLLALLAAAALVESACSGKTSGVASGANVYVGGSGGSGGSAVGDASPWPDAHGPGTGGATGGTGGGAAAGGTGTGGSAAGGSGTGGACTAELCNNLDDDCNGLVDDNLSRSCSSSCGSGTQTCSAGKWGACSAMQPLSCMDYSACKMSEQCVASCPGAPSETCNLADDNCNGKCDENAGCRTGVYRSYNSSTGEHFYTTSSTEAACCGFKVEFPNYYYLYKSPASGLVPFYRCRLASGKHFYTTSSSCEGAAGSTKEGTLGYIGKSATCGAVPLYRLSMSGDHFYTTSSSERQKAISGGYKDEGIAGYVWKAP
jgi:hypothetical protein